MKNISIIVPVFNTENYLERCVESVLNQSCREFELILVDDGSQDKSGEICDHYIQQDTERIKVIHQENAGVSAARNTGIKYAVGEYLFFLDSDDWLEKNALEKLYKVAQEEQADITICGLFVINEKGEPSFLQESFPLGDVLTTAQNKNLLFMFPSVCNKIFRKKIFDKTKVLFSPVAIAEDLQVLLKLIIQADRIVYMGDPLYYYFCREGSAMNSTNCEKNRDVVCAFDGLVTYYKEQGFYDQYREELEYLSIKHVFIDASVRVLKIDKNNAILKEIHQWFLINFPDCKYNKYLNKLTLRERIIFELLEMKRYNIIMILFEGIDRIRRLKK